jgi:hypothetical protein
MASEIEIPALRIFLLLVMASEIKISKIFCAIAIQMRKDETCSINSSNALKKSAMLRCEGEDTGGELGTLRERHREMSAIDVCGRRRSSTGSQVRNKEYYSLLVPATDK